MFFLPKVLRYSRGTPFILFSLLLPQKNSMEKSEPQLIGYIIRQMLSDPRIQSLLDDYGMMGLGTYVYLRNTIEAQSPGGLPLDYVIKSASSHASRIRIRSVLRNYGLFTEDEFGLVHVCELAPDHGTHTHGTHTDGMHEHTEEENINNNKKNNNIIFMPEKTVKIKRRFQKPTVEEVDAYCRQRQNCVDATRFCNFYESKGWMVGKSKMVDWKAAVRTWERGNNVNLNLDLNSNLNLDLNPVTTSGGIQYYNGRPLPADAPPRPSSTAEWDESSQSWFELYK